MLVGVPTTSMEPATRPRSAAPWEDLPRAPVPRASECAASSRWPVAAGLTPTPPTPRLPASPPVPTGTPAPTPTASAVTTSASCG